MSYLIWTILYYVALLLIAVIVYDSYLVFADPCKLPGPYGIPVLGYIPFMGKKFQWTFSELARKYGSIYQLRLGRKKLVVLNDFDIIKEAFGLPEFADRAEVSSINMLKNIVGETAAIGFVAQTPIQKYTRKLAMRSIGTMVNSKDSRVENLTNEAIDYALEQMKDGKKETIEVTKMSVGMIVGSLSFGHVFDATSEILHKVFDFTQVLNQFIALGNAEDFVPFFGSIFRWRSERSRNVLELFTKYVNEQIDKHSLKSSEEIRDIQDAIEHMYVSTKEELLGKLNISLNDAKHVGQALFGAGFATTSEHYAMALLLLGTYPDIQQKVYEDIIAAMGSEDIKDGISIDDRNRMPYTQAFLTELFRYFSHVPFAFPHATSTDVIFHGFHIPKGTLVISNLWLLHHDRKVFGADVHSFNPHRFLDADEKTLDERRKHVVPFGVGRRKCVGELLARRELFLLIAKTVQKAHVKLVAFEGVDPSDTDVGFSQQTKSSRIQLIRRK